jgi:hypothetical protein
MDPNILFKAFAKNQAFCMLRKAPSVYGFQINVESNIEKASFTGGNSGHPDATNRASIAHFAHCSPNNAL